MNPHAPFRSRARLLRACCCSFNHSRRSQDRAAIVLEKNDADGDGRIAATNEAEQEPIRRHGPGQGRLSLARRTARPLRSGKGRSQATPPAAGAMAGMMPARSAGRARRGNVLRIGRFLKISRQDAIQRGLDQTGLRPRFPKG